MNNTIDAKGRCLCGAVEVKATAIEPKLGACHCSSCRTWGGGPYLSIDCKTSVSFTGSVNISVYPSSEWAERGFCSTCGSHLFYRLLQSGDHIMPAGLFNLDAELDFDHQVFIDQKPSYYCFSNETTTMTGAELFAQFSDS